MQGPNNFTKSSSCTKSHSRSNVSIRPSPSRGNSLPDGLLGVPGSCVGWLHLVLTLHDRPACARFLHLTLHPGF
eukprot:411720-Pelagomonas_calceolata.AAC.1